MVALNINVAEIDPSVGATGVLPVMPKPGGLVRCDSVELKPNKEGTGQYLQLNVQVIEEGEHKGRTGAVRLNLQNPSAEAMRIAYAELSAIGHCAGISFIGTENDLVGATWRVATQLQAGDNPRGYTEIIGHYDAQGNPPKKGQFAPSAGGQQAPAAPPAPPAPPQQPQQPQQPEQQFAPPAAPQQPAQQFAPPAAPQQPQQPGQPQAPSWAQQ